MGKFGAGYCLREFQLAGEFLGGSGGKFGGWADSPAGLLVYTGSEGALFGYSGADS